MAKLAKRRTLRVQDAVSGLVLVLPAFLLYFLFVLYPTIEAGWIGFHRWDGFSKDMKWIGLNNYKFVFQDDVFWLAMRNSLKYSIVVTIAKNVLGILLAVLINRKIRLQAFFRTTIFIPVTLAFVVVGVLWSWIYNPNFGLLNSLLRELNLEVLIRGWLSDPKLALYSIMAVDIWRWTGYHVILLLAGLQAIPKDLYEAAEIDGAGPISQFIKITIPLLVPIFFVSIILSFTGGFVSNYDFVYTMTGGGPNHSTEVALTWIVNTAFNYGAVGKANAMSLILFVLLAVVSLPSFLIRFRSQREG